MNLTEVLSKIAEDTNGERTSINEITAKLESRGFGPLIIGLVCYVLWRLIQSVLNPGSEDEDAKDYGMRIFYFASAVLYASVCHTAFTIWQSDGSGGSGSNSQSLSAKLMEYEWGLIVLGIVGLVVVIFSFVQFKHPVKVDFMDKFALRDISSTQKKSSENVGRLGFGSRGVIYIIIGGFLMYSAYTSNPEQSGGLSKALITVLQQPFGSYLLAALGVGVLGFAAFCAFEARYRSPY